MPGRGKLTEFVQWCQSHIKGDEKGEGLTFRSFRHNPVLDETTQPVRNLLPCLRHGKSWNSSPVSSNEAYKSGQYNETEVRRELLDPFFKALGWG